MLLSLSYAILHTFSRRYACSDLSTGNCIDRNNRVLACVLHELYDGSILCPYICMGLRTLASLVVPITLWFNFLPKMYALEVYAFCLVPKLFYKRHLLVFSSAFYYFSYRCYPLASQSWLLFILTTVKHYSRNRRFRSNHLWPGL